ncbi:GerMN domain-containing protein [Kribbella sp. NBC_01245]|uniref:GerMN domain-containing protein n=1 Tax=Kribbella sp. NBC_01245 TaxID=2903578 RepID=UPI002E2E40A2|nr:GerMN domain-containing protein [Kribbella sp. NBC_01245]
MRPGTSLLAAVGALLIAATGCGVAGQNEPVGIDPTAIPSQLRSGATETPAPPSTSDPATSAVTVYFVRDDRLVGLRREAPRTPPAARIESVLQSLTAGPTDLEQGRAIASALPPDLQLTVIAHQGQLVDLELSGDTDGRSPTENVLAVGQIVLSITALPTVDEVRLIRDGAPVEALLADGALTTNPLKASDYASLTSP